MSDIYFYIFQVFIPEFLSLHINCFQPTKQAQYSLLDTSLDGEAIDDTYGLLTSLCNFASPRLKKHLQHAVQNSYAITIEKHNWNFRHSSTQNRSSTLINLPEEDDKLQTFSVISEPISKYLDGTSPLAGTFIKLYLTRNRLVKDASVIFENNVLCDAIDRGTRLNVFASLENGLMSFTKLTSGYHNLKNFVLECSSSFISLLEKISLYETIVECSLLKSLYTTVKELFGRAFLSTLSPDDWSQMTQILIECCLYSKNCHMLLLTHLELIVSLPPDLYDIVLSQGVLELREELKLHLNAKTFVESFSTKISQERHQFKRLLLLMKDVRKKSYLLLENTQLLVASDVLDLLKVCLESTAIDSKVRKILERRAKEVTWFEQVSVLIVYK